MDTNPVVISPEKVGEFAAIIAAGILSNPHNGDFSQSVSNNEVEKITSLSVRVAKAIALKLQE